MYHTFKFDKEKVVSKYLIKDFKIMIFKLL